MQRGAPREPKSEPESEEDEQAPSTDDESAEEAPCAASASEERTIISDEEIDRTIILFYGSDEQKTEAASVLAQAMSAGGPEALAETQARFRKAGAVEPLVDLVSEGSERQKEWAASALAAFASGNAESQEEIASAGGVEPLVALARDGTDRQKEAAAAALGVMAVKNAPPDGHWAPETDHQTDIGRAGAAAPLVDLVLSSRTGFGRFAWRALSSPRNEIRERDLPPLPLVPMSRLRRRKRCWPAGVRAASYLLTTVPNLCLIGQQLGNKNDQQLAHEVPPCRATIGHQK